MLACVLTHSRAKRRRWLPTLLPVHYWCFRCHNQSTSFKGSGLQHLLQGLSQCPLGASELLLLLVLTAPTSSVWILSSTTVGTNVSALCNRWLPSLIYRTDFKKCWVCHEMQARQKELLPMGFVQAEPRRRTAENQRTPHCLLLQAGQRSSKLQHGKSTPDSGLRGDTCSWLHMKTCCWQMLHFL